MTPTVVELVGLIAAVGAAAAAFGSWHAARKANATASSLTAIERQRRHTDLTPDLQITCHEKLAGRADLYVSLEGPPGLDGIDSMRVEIRNDRHGRAPAAISGGPTAEEIAEVIWGPYRLLPAVEGVDRLGRAATCGPLQLGDWTQFVLEFSPHPKWSTKAENWRQRWDGKPIRLRITCHRGDESWSIPREISIERRSET